VQSAFGTVVIVVCAVGAVGALVTLLLNRRTWENYDEGHLVLDSEAPRRPRPGVTAGAADAERDEEIRQMIEARNARRRRRGEPELDAAAEIARLSPPAIDDELAGEIRDLVIARNHRRARRGEPPLDVEAEIKRQIAELQGL
jgi:hypothetical protein